MTTLTDNSVNTDAVVSGSRRPMRNSQSVIQPPQNLSTDTLRSSAQSSDSPGRGARWSMTIINFWLDATLMLVLVALGIVSVILQFVFPPGISANGWTLWSLDHTQWTSLQFGLLSVLGVGVLVHVMLHWTWVCGVISRRLLGNDKLPADGIRTVYGVGLLIILLMTSAIAVGIATLMIEMPPQ
jgi:hypothetical protein